jgi:hypothetical protein
MRAVGKRGGLQAPPWTLTVRGSDAVLTVRLRVPRTRRLMDKVDWIDPAPPDEAVRVIVVRCLPDVPVTGVMWSTSLTSGGTLAVIVVAGPLNGEETALLARSRATLATRAAYPATLDDPTGFEWGQAGDRTRFWMTVGVD